MSTGIPSLPPKGSKPSDGLQKATTLRTAEETQVVPQHSLIIQDLANPVSLFPSDKLKQFEQSLVLLRGYIANVLESKNEEYKELLDKQIAEIDSIIEQFTSLNDGTQKNNINERLKHIHQLEAQFRQLENLLFTKIQNYQIQYKDILENKLENKIRDKEDFKNALFSSMEKDSDIDNFIKQYRRSCTKFHLLTEFQKRLKEDRIGGVI